MAHKKRRVIQHIMEDKSLAIIRDVLPEEWVLREYKPDYGHLISDITQLCDMFRHDQSQQILYNGVVRIPPLKLLDPYIPSGSIPLV